VKGRHGAHPKTHYLKPGEIHITSDPSLITTVLGSCLCLTMHHKPTGLSVICHAVMPSSSEARKKDDSGNSIFQYVDTSLEWMIAQYEKSGIEPASVEVKMFGGAAMFSDAGPASRDLGVGKRNIEIATEMIKKKRLKLTAWNVGGNQGRKLIFNTLTGEVLAKFIMKNGISQIDFGVKK
jgi:chemotaxis protein CheD